MRAVEFLQKIAQIFSSDILLEFCDNAVFASLISLTEEYPYNNLLQLRVDQLVSLALEKVENNIVLEHIMDNSGLISLILKVANQDAKYTFEASKSEINLGYTVFVRKWAKRLKDLCEQDCEPVKQAVQCAPEVEQYLDGDLKL